MKKLLAMILALVMVLALAACGKDQPNVTDPVSGGNVSNGGTQQDNTPRKDVKVLTSVKQVKGDGTVRANYQYTLTDNRLLTAMDLQEGRAELDLTLDYDEAAKKVTVTAVNPDPASTNAAVTIEWNEVGQIISATETEEGKVWKTEYTYNDAGDVASKKVYIDGWHSSTVTYTYHSSGKLMTECKTQGDGTLVYQKSSAYDDHGNKLSYTVDHGDGDVRTDRYSYTYDDNGNVTCKQDYDDEGYETSKVEYTYDENGRMASKQTYNDDGIKSGKYTYTYDSNGNMLKEQEYNSWGEPSNSVEYTYDEDGRLIKQTSLNSDGELDETLTYTYETMHMSDVEYVLYNALMTYADTWY